MKTITITIENFNNRMKTIETKNLKKYGKSLTWVSLSNYFNSAIIEIYDNLLVLDKDKYNQIRQKATTNSL